MAVPKVEVDAMWNGEELKRGTDEAASAVEDLESQVKESASAVEAALRGMDDVAGTSMTGLSQEVEQGESKLKEMGATASEEIPGAMTDLSDSAADAATGLSTAFATLGPGGIALGAALAGIGILLRKSEEAKEAIKEDASAWEQAYIEGLGQITAAARRAKIESDRANEESPIAKIEALIDSGAPVKLATAFAGLYGTPSERASALRELDKAVALADENVKIAFETEGVRSEAYLQARREQEQLQQVNGLLDIGNEARVDARDKARDVVSAYDRLNLLTKEENQALFESARYWESIKNNARAVEEYSSRIGGNLGNAVRQSGLLDLALNGVPK